MLKIATVFGTRPEVIKIAPVIREFNKYPQKLSCFNCVTGQHRHMIDSLLKLFNIKVDCDLNIMQENQSLEYITIAVLTKMKDIFLKEKPDYLLVQGDTTTAMAASLAAFYHKIKIAHIEAGLRTWDKFNPYPEEVNRRIIDSLSDLCFAHTQKAKQNLIKEGVSENKIEVTGNTVIDILIEMTEKDFNPKGSPLEKITLNEKKVILVTAHRRENFGQPISNICEAIREIAVKCDSEISVIYPVHLNPNVHKPVYTLLENLKNVFLIEPLEYEPFVQLMKKSYLILTDSGGIQEEAPSLGKPVLVLREVTERPEAVDAGVVKVIGTNVETIIKETLSLLRNKNKYESMSKAINPYGDGKASKRIVQRLLKESIKNE